MSRDRILVVKKALRNRLYEMIGALRIVGFRPQDWGGKIYPLNPTRADRSPGSFVIWTAPDDGQGAWKDYATGEHGDVLDLVAYIRTGGDYKSQLARSDALKWAENWTGLRSWTVREYKASAAKIARDQQLAAEKAIRDQENFRRRALALWLKAEPDIRGTVIEDYYWQRRGIRLAEVEAPLHALRYLPDHPYEKDGPRYPCQVALMSGADGRPVGIHRTWIARDGSDKAPLKHPRKMWPKLKGTGAHIRISKGADDLSPEEAARHGVVAPLILCEGADDGVAIARAKPDFRIWACGSLALFNEVPILPCVEAFIVWADNDWGKPQAQTEFLKGVKRLEASRLPVEVVRSPIGKDPSDLVRWSS